MFRPMVQQFATLIRIQNRVVTPDGSGGSAVSFQDASPALDFCNWKGKGGTRNAQSDAFVISDTADVTMWYRPDVVEKGRILLNDDETMVYEIANVENVEMRNMWLNLKVVRSALIMPHTVTLQSAVFTTNEALLSVEQWVDTATVPATVETLSGHESMSAGAITAESTIRVRIQYQAGVSESMRVKFLDRLYNITSVVPVFNESGEELHLLCTELKTGGSI